MEGATLCNQCYWEFAITDNGYRCNFGTKPAYKWSKLYKKYIHVLLASWGPDISGSLRSYWWPQQHHKQYASNGNQWLFEKVKLVFDVAQQNILKAIKTWQNQNLSITKQRIFRLFQAINSWVDFWNITLQVRRFAVNQADFHQTLMVAFKKMIDSSFNKASVSHQNVRANNPKYGAGARGFINSVISPIVPIPPINFG